MNLKELLNRTHRLHWEGSKAEDATMSVLECIQRELGPDTDVTELTGAKIQDYVLDLKDHIAPSTINRRLSCLSRALGVAVEMGYLRSKPKLPFQREPRGRERTVSPEEFQGVVDYLRENQRPGEGLDTFAVFLRKHGCRVGEALKLTPKDIQGGKVFFRDTKNGRTRVLPLLSEVPPKVTYRRFNYLWGKAKKHLGIEDPEFVPHALRHTMATELQEKHGDLALTKEVLGHTDVKTTMRYAHVTTDRIEAALVGNG